MVDLTKEEAMVLLYETMFYEELDARTSVFIDQVSTTRFRELRESGRAKLQTCVDGDISDAEEKTLP